MCRISGLSGDLDRARGILDDRGTISAGKRRLLDRRHGWVDDGRFLSAEDGLMSRMGEKRQEILHSTDTNSLR